MSAITAARTVRGSPLLLSSFRLAAPRSSVSCRNTQPQRQASSTRNASQEVEDKKSAQGESKSIDRQSYEYSLSGTDDAVAGQSELSFDGSKSLSPEEAKELAGKDASKHNTLEMSPADHEVSTVGTDAEYRAITKAPPTTTKGNSNIKSKSTVTEDEPANRAYAGTDKRKPQSPQDVAAAKGHVPPGAR